MLITGGQVTIDKDDYELVSQYKWHVGDTGYAVWRGIKDGVKQTIRMHRLIMQTPAYKVTDHINHDKLDNRKSNLRICTQSDNMRNKTNQGKGYWYHKQNNNWIVEINGKHRGCFLNEEEAKDFAYQVRQGKFDKKPKLERTHCKHGHSLEKVYIVNGYKFCKQCQSIRSKEYYVRKKEQQMAKDNGR